MLFTLAYFNSKTFFNMGLPLFVVLKRKPAIVALRKRMILPILSISTYSEIVMPKPPHTIRIGLKQTSDALLISN